MLFQIHQIYYTVSKNLSIQDVIPLLFSIIIVLCNRRKYPCIPPLYSVFLILYITLLRRAPGFNESICFKLKLRPNVVVWAGNLLNLVLYVPYGVTSWQWKREGKKVVAVGLALSVSCEVLQYLTGRGMAYVNDVLFNTLGAAVGVWISAKVYSK